MRLSRINLLLGATVLLMAVFAGFSLIPDETSAVTRLTKQDPRSLRHIRIDRGDGNVLAFERNLTGWRMTIPYNRIANPDKLHAVVRIAAAPSHRRFAVEDTDPAELGFSPPPVHLQLDGELLEIGGTEPIRRRRYVRIGEWVHLIDDLFQHHLLAVPETFVQSPQAGRNTD